MQDRPLSSSFERRSRDLFSLPRSDNELSPKQSRPTSALRPLLPLAPRHEEDVVLLEVSPTAKHKRRESVRHNSPPPTCDELVGRFRRRPSSSKGHNGFMDTMDFPTNIIERYSFKGNASFRSTSNIQVSEGKNKITGKQVVIKSVRKDCVQSGELHGLKTQIKVLKQVKHPHIVQLVDVFEDENKISLVFELYVPQPLCIG
eukprot:NODE_1356_length_992_cov_103.749735_g1044_i0.p1 GENE.NODE_1356_length_992_cov_103.749735_g1044_i0~~NODE_1356_length_992_cov_103.749735_g1044_i0.p1  ORF type:complete len:202 (-),score=22.54 NODE_1356_length_992_cov_103.749735_g1044_i0:245-850(-)